MKNGSSHTAYLVLFFQLLTMKLNTLRNRKSRSHPSFLYCVRPPVAIAVWARAAQGRFNVSAIHNMAGTHMSIWYMPIYIPTKCLYIYKHDCCSCCSKLQLNLPQ